MIEESLSVTVERERNRPVGLVKRAKTHDGLRSKEGTLCGR
jgi:hypothetical protein